MSIENIDVDIDNNENDWRMEKHGITREDWRALSLWSHNFFFFNYLITTTKIYWEVPSWTTTFLNEFDKSTLISSIYKRVLKQLHNLCLRLLRDSIPSQKVMKEKPRKRPRVPPNSATREAKEYSSSSRSTLVKYINGPQKHNNRDTTWSNLETGVMFLVARNSSCVTGLHQY